MKRFLFFVALCTVVNAHAVLPKSVDAKNNLHSSFGAPVVPNEGSVTDMQVGQIIYDASTDTFKGLNASGTWNPMTIPSGNPVVSSEADLRVERALISPSCSESAGWITSTSGSDNGSGCTHTIAGFSAAPTCVCTTSNGGSTQLCQATVNSATSVTGVVFLSNTAHTGSNTPYSLICMGPNDPAFRK